MHVLIKDFSRERRGYHKLCVSYTINGFFALLYSFFSLMSRNIRKCDVTLKFYYQFSSNFRIAALFIALVNSFNLPLELAEQAAKEDSTGANQ